MVWCLGSSKYIYIYNEKCQTCKHAMLIHNKKQTNTKIANNIYIIYTGLNKLLYKQNLQNVYKICVYVNFNNQKSMLMIVS